MLLLREMAHGDCNNKCQSGKLCTEYVTRRLPPKMKIEGMTVTWTENLVRPRRLELPLRLKNSDLNAARLPIPPRPHMVVSLSIPTTSYNEKRALFRFAKFLPPGLATLRQTSLMPINNE